LAVVRITAATKTISLMTDGKAELLKACRDWLDYAPAMLNFAPEFCMNADILFDLQYDQAGPRRIN
jgi:hypothetical protein